MGEGIVGEEAAREGKAAIQPSGEAREGRAEERREGKRDEAGNKRKG